MANNVRVNISSRNLAITLDNSAYIYIYFAVPKSIRGKLFYSAGEVAALAGIHRLTLLRWIREGKLVEVDRDRNGWRLFSEEVAQQIVEFAKGINVRSSPNQSLLFSGQTSDESNTLEKSVLKSRE